MQENPVTKKPTEHQHSRRLTLITRLRKRAHDLGLLSRLLLAGALVGALVLAGGVLLLDRVAGTLKENIKQERLLLGQAVAEDVDTALSHSVTELRQLAAGYRLAPTMGDPGGIQEAVDYLAGASEMFTRGILIVGPSGEVLVADRVNPRLTEAHLRQLLADFSAQRAGSAEVFTAVFSLEDPRSPVIAIAVPVQGPAAPGYVVGLVETEDSYPDRVLGRAVRLGDSGHAEMVDGSGVALFSTEREHLLVTSDHPSGYRRLLLRGEAAIAELAHDPNGTPEGEEHLMSFIPLRTLPWAVSMGTGVSEAYAPVRQIWYTSLGYIAVLAGIAFVATVFLSRMLVRPVRALSATARDVAQGNQIASVDTPWGGEIGELAASLETMRVRLQARGAELEEQVERRTRELDQRSRELSVQYETIQRQDKQLHVLLARVLGAQEDERKRVARELHDGIGQALSAVSLGLDRLEREEADRWPQLREHVEALKVLATDSLSDLRRLTVALRPAALDDLGLVPAIRRYAELYLAPAGADLHVEEDPPAIRLSPPLETVIYRVAQEAINNAARHSQATRVAIDIQSVGDTLSVTITDNGRGFDPTEPNAQRGVGIQGMAERASLAGGKLTVKSQPGGGTTVRLDLPLGEPRTDG